MTPSTPRASARKVTGEVSVLRAALPIVCITPAVAFPSRAGAGEEGGPAGEPVALAPEGAIRVASFSLALTRSTAWPYSFNKSLWRMSACNSSAVSGAMREAGGISLVATTGVGEPRASTTGTVFALIARAESPATEDPAPS